MSSILDNIEVAERPAPASVITANFASTKPTGDGNVDSTASRQWATRPNDERFTSLDALIASVQDRRERSADRVVPLSSLRARRGQGGGIALFDMDQSLPEMAPSNHAFSQFCTQVGAPASYLRTLPSSLVAHCLNHGLAHLEHDSRVQLLHTGSSLRGVTGENYGRIWDAELAGAVKQITEAGGGRWEVPTAFRTAGNMGQAAYATIDPTIEDTTLYASDRDCFLFLVDQRNPIEAGKLPNGDPDLYFRGFYAWNGECGGVSNGVGTFLYRWVCYNRNIYGQRGFQKLTLRHTKNAAQRFAADMIPALQAFVDGSSVGIVEGLLATKSTKLARDDEKRHSILEMYDFGPREQKLILDRIMEEEGHPAESAFDFIQGITAYARSIPNQDARIAVERVGERIFQQVIAATPASR